MRRQTQSDQSRLLVALVLASVAIAGCTISADDMYAPVSTSASSPATATHIEVIIAPIQVTASAPETEHLMDESADVSAQATADMTNTPTGAMLNLPTVTPPPTVAIIATIVRTPAPPGAGQSTEGAAVTYSVELGDTLYALALRFDTTIEALRRINNLDGDLIRAGDLLVIPGDFGPPVVSDTPTTRPSLEEAPAIAPLPPVVAPPPPSILSGNLVSAYPSTLETEHFTLHYTPGTLPASQPNQVAALVQRAYEHLEQLLQRPLPGVFDAFAAGTLFAPPDQALRGRSFSTQRRLFFLYDGTGVDWDRQYIVGHELTHLYSWNVIGAPSSVMLSEGLAVYAGVKLVEGGGHLDLSQICLAYQRAGVLPRVGGTLSYRGHIRDMENYYAAGCFVQFLVETYGIDALALLYPTGDYAGIYGKTLEALTDEWQQTLAASTTVLPFDAAEFVEDAATVKAGYAALFANFQPTVEAQARYAELDAARTALLEGRLDAVSIR